MHRRYTKVITAVRNPDGAIDRFIGEVPAIPNCRIVADDRETAVIKLVRRASAILEDMIRRGLEVPEREVPSGFDMIIDRESDGPPYQVGPIEIRTNGPVEAEDTDKTEDADESTD